MSTHTVLEVQTALKAQWYNPGPLDGLDGTLTSQAVMAFQSASGLPPTGKIDSPTLDALFNPQPKETDSMNLSLLTLIISHLNLLPFFQQDVTTEVKVLNSSADGAAKLATTIAVLEDIIAQCKAAINNTAIPPTTAKAP